ncbi:extracellular solute-binding protein [Candidatus Roizmanbacteria bacterium]|nr:extracellular solute-binding protein [Candidatus Roizmanbacteria bacterium]
MDDNKVNADQNQSLGDSQDKPVELTGESTASSPPQSETINKSGPIFESVPEEELKPEEVAPEVATPTGEEVTPPGSENPTDVPPVVYEENKSKYFIIAGGAIFFLLVLLFFLRIIFGGKGPSKEVKLTYWGLWEEKEVFTPVIEDYQRKNPGVKIDYQKMSPQDYRDKLLARSKNGQGPDIFRFHNTWLPEIKDVVTSIPENIMSNSDFEKTFYKIHQSDLKNGNFYYGLPLYLDGLVLVYNDSLFKKAGIAAPPSTWDELTDTVVRLTVKDTNGQLVTAGIALGLASNVDHFSEILGLMIVQNGGSLKTLDQPEAAGALESYRRFAEPPNNFWDDSMPNSLTAFIQEKVAMVFVPTWEILLIKNANPDLQLKAVPLPTVPGGSPVSIANYWVEGVSRYSKNQLEAWKFLRFLIEKDTLTKLYEIESKLRLFGEPYSRVDLGSLLAQNEYVGAVIKQSDYFVSLPLISRTFDNGLNDEIIQYLENAVNATVNGLTYADGLKTAKQGVDQVFSKYKIE